MITVKESISEMESDIGNVDVETIDIIDENNNLIFGAINTPKTKEMALLIVKRYNMFPELVTALESLIHLTGDVNLDKYYELLKQV